MSKLKSVKLFFLPGSGIHIVWGIYRVFNLYAKREASEMHSMTSRCIIWSWYVGAIIGSICAGFALQKIRKNRIYVSKNPPKQEVNAIKHTK